MQDRKHKLSLDRPVTYQIRVPGMLDENWVDWGGDMTILIDDEKDGQPVSVLTGTFDQAALHGLLRRLYSRGVPLIAVIWMNPED